LLTAWLIARSRACLETGKAAAPCKPLKSYWQGLLGARASPKLGNIICMF